MFAYRYDHIYVMWSCVCECMCGSICVHPFTHVIVCMFVYVCIVCVYVHMYMYIFMSMHIFMSVHGIMNIWRYFIIGIYLSQKKCLHSEILFIFIAISLL